MNLLAPHCFTLSKMSEITDEYMHEMIGKSKYYSIIILRHGPNWNRPGAEKIIWEHGRRNFALQKDGLLPIVCAVSDGSNLSGIGIFIGSIEEVIKLMAEDPGVKEGLFVYEVHDCRSRPGTSLP